MPASSGCCWLVLTGPAGSATEIHMKCDTQNSSWNVSSEGHHPSMFSPQLTEQPLAFPSLSFFLPINCSEQYELIIQYKQKINLNSSFLKLFWWLACFTVDLVEVKLCWTIVFLRYSELCLLANKKSIVIMAKIQIWLLSCTGSLVVCARHVNTLFPV